MTSRWTGCGARGLRGSGHPPRARTCRARTCRRGPVGARTCRGAGARTCGARTCGREPGGANRDAERGRTCRGADLWVRTCGGEPVGREPGGARTCGAGPAGRGPAGANLRGANLPTNSAVRSLGETPSGWTAIYPTPTGWMMRVGCWVGTPANPRRPLIARDEGRPEATPEQIPERRPFLHNALALAEWHISQHDGVIDDLAARWLAIPVQREGAGQ